MGKTLKQMIATNPKHRVTIGGYFKDFDVIEDAIKYLNERLKIFTYGSINKTYSFENERKK